MTNTRLAQCALALFFVYVAMGQQSADPLQRARSLLTEGNLTESEAAIRSYLKDNPTSADAHFLLGDALFRQQKAKESLAEFTAGASTRRPGANELRTVASDYVLLGDFVDADKWFSEVTAETPNDAEAWYLLGRTKYNENRFAEAISSFDHVLTLHPKDVRAEDNRGLSLQGLGQVEEAKTAFQNAIAWQGTAPTDAQPYLNLGSLLTDQGDTEQAIRNLEEAATLASENPKVHEELGRAYQVKGDLAKAQSELEAAVKLAPNAAALHFKLGQVYHHRGLDDRAQQEFAICAKLNGAHSSTEVPNPFSRSGPTKPR